MIFFCNFALIMRQRFFQPVISLLFATLLMTGCGGKGSVKLLSITLDSIVIDTTATLEKGDVCKVHLKLHLLKARMPPRSTTRCCGWASCSPTTWH